ncbi:esterase-like activity of phytase family protein [Candidatus Parabeggiatoa sp. HSG14]|uniref:esterase-like activity of phytase family protein n=1 Tax=Candidatus Parabeggiatoa sp. HSG14 TaxID=3055593 RepID=UPI0025A77A46|nr:esterase-like activity of phytase family protein [Thiotrichales bacterium HSG14]
MNIIKKLPLLILFSITVVYADITSYPVNFSEQYQVGDTYMGIRLGGTIELTNGEIDGFKLAELSGLAWDEDEKLLYAVTDKATLFHLRPIITDNILTDVNLIATFQLQNKKSWWLGSRDSEGLAILNGNNGKVGDSELVISFERIPQIARFTPKGKKLANYTLPNRLRNITKYSSLNKLFEAVTVHPDLGILTAPEWPLKGNKGKIVIYALDGQQWTFPHHTSPNSAVVALETLEDGSILVLERAFVSPHKPLVISLRQVWLPISDKCSKQVKVKQVAVFNSHQGWQLDNFEGLTHHQGAYFFMVSDDNNRSSQRTLLSYFEIVNNN